MADLLTLAAPADPCCLLTEYFGFESFRPGQLRVIRRIMEGGQALAVMPTGAGKSLCYQLPALASTDGVTLVVSPLIALMKDQVDELERLRIPSTFINSSIPASEQRARIDAVREGRYRLVYVAPERFRSPLFRRMIEQTRVRTVAIDEAHCVSEWGHDFRPDYLKLRGFLEAMRPRSIVALTATATPRVQADILEQLGLKDVETIVTGFDRPNLAFSARRFSNERDKDRFVRRFVESRAGSGIVYAGTRRTAEAVADLLYSYGDKAEAYHAGLEEETRTAVQDRFMSGETRIIVATNAFGMGIDKPDVRFVFHYNMPGSAEAYYQEAGRAGRDGEPAECLLCSSAADWRLREFFIEQSYPSPEQIRAVYEALLSAKDNPIFWTVDQIRKAASADLSEPGASSCLRILEQFGAIQRLDPREHKAVIVAEEPVENLRGRVHGPQKRRIFEALAQLLGSAEGIIQDNDVNLEVLAARIGVDSALLQRHLRDLALEGILEYHPPFRGRGVRLLGGGAPFESIPIDWQSLERRKAVEYEKLDAIAKYVASGKCRRQWLVGYFGEEFRDGGHCACDRCAGTHAVDQPSSILNPSARAKGYTAGEARIARAVLACVKEMPWQVGAQKIAQIVRGARTRWIVEAGLERLGAFGSAQASQDQVNAIVLRLIQEGFLVQSPGKYPTVSLTAPGREVLAGRTELPEREEIKALRPDTGSRPSAKRQAPPAAPPAERSAKSEMAEGRGALSDDELFKVLRDLRAREAKRRRVAVFKVLTDATLRALARARPRTLAEFLEIKGIGPAKAQKYGAVFLEEIRRASSGSGAEPAREIEPPLPEAPGDTAIEPPAGMTDGAFDSAAAAEESEAAHDEPAFEETPDGVSSAGAESAWASAESSARIIPDGAEAADAFIPDPLAVLDRLARLFVESEREPAREAFERIRMFDPQLALERLIGLWDDSAPKRAQLRVIWAAGEFGQRTAEPWLAERMLLAEAVIRSQTCEALRKIGGPRAEVLLLERLALDRDDGVQSSSAQALGHVGGPCALAALERMVGSGACSARVRQAAAQALNRLRRSGAATELVQPGFLDAGDAEPWPTKLLE